MLSPAVTAWRTRRLLHGTEPKARFSDPYLATGKLLAQKRAPGHPITPVAESTSRKPQFRASILWLSRALQNYDKEAEETGVESKM
jgi:hypothetical protein